MAKKSPLHITFQIENNQWVAKGPRVRVAGPTLQATRRRARKAVEEAYGPATDFESSLLLPSSVRTKIDENRQMREQSRKLRTELRAHTLEILEVLRSSLGASYEDASELLGIDGAGLMRLVHSTTRLNVDDD